LYRMVKSAIKNKEIDLGHDLSDEEVVLILEKEAKQRRDSIEQFKKGGREELAKKEELELSIIEGFLPEKLSEDEVREKVQEIVEKSENKDFGRLMGAAMAELKGKADGATVQKILNEELGN